MRAHCAACRQAVAVLQPRVIDVTRGQYVIEGRCKNCGEPVTFNV